MESFKEMYNQSEGTVIVTQELEEALLLTLVGTAMMQFANYIARNFKVEVRVNDLSKLDAELEIYYLDDLAIIITSKGKIKKVGNIPGFIMTGIKKSIGRFLLAESLELEEKSPKV